MDEDSVEIIPSSIDPDDPEEAAAEEALSLSLLDRSGKRARNVDGKPESSTDRSVAECQRTLDRLEHELCFSSKVIKIINIIRIQKLIN